MTLDQLEALCGGATAGEREFVRTHGGRKARVVLKASPYIGIYNVNCNLHQTANGELAVACSPDYILKLIRVARAAKYYREHNFGISAGWDAVANKTLDDALKALTPETGT